MIELAGLSKTYTVSRAPVHAVRTLDLTIPDGQFVSIVGHSGSGKSTLLSMIGGLARPETGTVTIDGVDIWGFDDRSRSRLRNEKFGFIYQFASLLPTLTAAENVLLPTVFGSLRPRAEAVRLLERVGLGDKAGRYPSQLSGGEQQRVAIARAFINEPRIVLADEPTGELDEETEASIMTFLQQVNREGGVTIVMVTHSSELAIRAGRRLRMKDGALEEVR
jgi:putative ABC transport system ATP-binding protein/lipoprotein-releasing system ATP-binding protein